MYDTHTPAEWVAYGFLGLIPVGVLKLALAFADTDLAYFDPRPLVRSVLASDAWRRLLAELDAARQAVTAAPAAVRVHVRAAAVDAAVSAAVLLALLTAPTGDPR